MSAPTVQTPNAAPTAAPRRPRVSGWAWTAIVLVALLAVMAASTTYRSVDEQESGTAAPKVFDPVAFGRATYEPKVVPAIEVAAVGLDELVPALRADPEAAGQRYGRRSGTSPYSFAVAGTGIAGKPVSNLLPVTVEGLPADTDVSLQIGPAINGTVLRDAAGFITFGQFVNQVEYSDAATALNNEMRASILDDLDRESLQGKEISWTGAFTFLSPTTITITPVALEVGL